MNFTFTALMLILFLAFEPRILLGQENRYFQAGNILMMMHGVNDYQIGHPWTQDDDFNWIRGTYYTGVMAAFQSTGDGKFLKQCEKWGVDHLWGIPEIQRGAGASGANVLTCSQTWLECYFERNSRERIEPVIEHLRSLKSKNPVTQPMDWYWEGGRRYVDALYVGPPALIMLYRATQDDIYLQWMESFFWDVYGKLYDQEDSLFYRDQRFKQGYGGRLGERDIMPDSIARDEARRSYVYQRTLKGNKVFWSRGNGWAFAGIARILKYLPEEHGSYERYLSLFRQMAWSLKKRQGADGYWRMNLDDPDDYPYAETSGTALFTYGLAMGINAGWLPEGDFLPVVRKVPGPRCVVLFQMKGEGHLGPACRGRALSNI